MTVADENLRLVQLPVDAPGAIRPYLSLWIKCLIVIIAGTIATWSSDMISYTNNDLMISYGKLIREALTGSTIYGYRRHVYDFYTHGAIVYAYEIFIAEIVLIVLSLINLVISLKKRELCVSLQHRIVVRECGNWHYGSSKYSIFNRSLKRVFAVLICSVLIYHIFEELVITFSIVFATIVSCVLSIALDHKYTRILRGRDKNVESYEASNPYIYLLITIISITLCSILIKITYMYPIIYLKHYLPEYYVLSTLVMADIIIISMVRVSIFWSSVTIRSFSLNPSGVV